MIETHGLTKDFDDFRAVDQVTLRVAPGEVLAMLGPNGAGKTTTVRMMTSILAPSAGAAKIAGFDVVLQPEQVRAHVGVLTEQHGLYDRMKALEYLSFFGELYRIPNKVSRDRAYQLMERFGLTYALERRVGDYSKGMKQKLALVRAMLHNPPVLLLDEPTSAMDPQSAKQVRDAIIEMRHGEKRTFLITTHNLTEAHQLADRIAIIRHGRIIANGTFGDLAAQFAGQPIMEVRVKDELDGAVTALAELVHIERTGNDWLHYRTTDPANINPQVLRKLLGLGIDVVTLTQITKSLEDIYLQVVQEDEAQETQQHGQQQR